MRLEFKGNKIDINPALAILVTQVIIFCDSYKTPLFFTDISEYNCEFSTLGWTSKLIYNLNYQLNRGYSDLGKPLEDVCKIVDNGIKIVTNTIPITRFVKED